MGIDMNKDSDFFRGMIDDLVGFADYDPELKAGLQWLDKEAQKEGITFYDKIYDVLNRYNKKYIDAHTDSKAKDWLKHKDD